MNFCSQCGQPVVSAIPDGDSRPRYVCPACAAIHYQNPKVVVGCVPEHAGRILLCRRAIEPRKGYWTVPAGFMEIGESLPDAAVRETWEEARARVEIGELFSVVDVIQAAQVHVFFTARMPDPAHAAGEESLETRLFLPGELPWKEIAFPSVQIALEQYLGRRPDGPNGTHVTTAPRRRLL